MGMFDYVQYYGPLPKDERYKSRIRVSFDEDRCQTKSVRLWETQEWQDIAYNTGCVTITINEDGNMLDPNLSPMNWTGVLNFYNDKYEFYAEIIKGKVVSIKGL